MHKGSDVIGKVVVTYDTGERVERVQDLLFDQDSNQLLGILVDEGGWLSGARVVALKDVQAIGPNAVVIPSKSAIAKSRKIPEIRQILKRNNVLKDTRIMTTNGRDLGTTVDLYFNEETGVVEGYEVSGGLFADMYSGRSFVPAPQTLNIGEDVAFVPPEIADLMEEQVDGIRGAVQTASGQLQTTTELAGQKLQDATQVAGTRLQDATQAASARLQAGTQLTSARLQEVMRSTIASSMKLITDPSEQKLFVIGKIVDRDVIAPNGTLLVAQGQQVTPLMAEEAQRQGVLDQLYQAAGGRFAADLNRRLQAATEVASQRLQEATQTTGESLQAGTESASQRIQEVTQSTVASLMSSITDPTEQKLFVIGKTVDRNVTAPDGTLLATQGQTVTLLMAEESERQGILHQLYQAVGGSFAAELNRRLQETADSSSQSVQAFSHDRTAELTNTLVNPAEQKAFVIGKTVNQDVIAPGRTLLSAQGQIVTRSVAEAAERQGILDQLYRAVGGGLTSGLSRAAGGILAGPMLNQTLGRRMLRMVRAEDGSIIGAPGQIVTEQVVARARTHHKEQELMDATGLTSGEAIRSGTSSTLSETGARLHQGTAQARESTNSLLEMIREEVEAFQEYIAQVIEDRRIKRALGRPVSRVILDKQDDVILNVGEMITHRAIELSRQAGVLDILLSSVYVKQPELSNAELRASELGEARLKGRDQPAASL